MGKKGKGQKTDYRNPKRTARDDEAVLSDMDDEIDTCELFLIICVINFCCFDNTLSHERKEANLRWCWMLCFSIHCFCAAHSQMLSNEGYTDVVLGPYLVEKTKH